MTRSAPSTSHPSPGSGDSGSTDHSAPPPRAASRVALVGNPNTGKTTLFNRLCGLRSKTANFPGSTVDARVGVCVRGDQRHEIVDLPGTYSLDLDLPESHLCRDCLEGRVKACEPDVVLIVVDATNLARNLQFAVSVLRRSVRALIALNMVDLAARRGITIDTELLAEHLGVPVVAIGARSGMGVDRLISTLPQAHAARVDLPAPGAECAAWVEERLRDSLGGGAAVGADSDTLTDRLDTTFTHPILGLLVFALVMVGLFSTIFWFAKVPMDLVESGFALLGSAVERTLPDGAIRELLVDGIIGGLAGTLVFLPQICLLFFLLSLLEDTGYLARAAFVMDRVMCRFGLPGHAFVPLLASHACALPGIMSTRLIPDRNERLATILVAPFMSCTARIPVYVLLTGLLFADRPILAGLAFTGCYALGAVAAMASALLARRTILRGRARPMVLELPTYKMPSLRTALLTTIDRAIVFLRNAGTVIMAICVVMWWLSAYPKAAPPAEAIALRAEAEELRQVTSASGEATGAAVLLSEADALEHRAQQLGSFAGRIGGAVQPIFAPLGADRQLTVAILTSFLAREVFRSTMTIVSGAGEDPGDEGIVAALENTTRDDGTPLFNPPTCAAMLVFFVLAMQCLPTLAVTRRETGSWKWAALQFVWMTALAWALGAGTYALVGAFTGGA